MLSSIICLFDELDKNNIVYCHWKSNEHLNESINGDTDLDVLFYPEQRNILNSVLEKNGLKRFRATEFMQYNGIEDYIGIDIKEAKIWHLHVHYRLTLGGSHLKGYTLTDWAPLILANRRLDSSGIYTSAVEDELILLLVRMSLKVTICNKRKRIGSDDLKELQWLKNKLNLNDFNERCDLLLSESSKKEILRLLDVQLKRKRQLKRLKKIIQKDFAIYAGCSRIKLFFKRIKRTFNWIKGGISRKKNNISKPYRRVSPSGGSVVAFLGSDGAGKSSTINYLFKEFNKKIDTKVIYLGSGDGQCAWYRKPLRFFAKKIGGKGVGKEIENNFQNPNKKKKRLKTFFYRIAKIIWARALASEKKKKYRLITRLRNQGIFVMTDRYPQTNVCGCSDGPLLHQYLSRKKGLLRKIALKEDAIYRQFGKNVPDLMVKLRVDPEISLQRKPEMTLDEILAKNDAVEKCNSALKIISIDTSVSMKESCGKIMEEIWKII